MTFMNVIYGRCYLRWIVEHINGKSRPRLAGMPLICSRGNGGLFLDAVSNRTDV